MQYKNLKSAEEIIDRKLIFKTKQAGTKKARLVANDFYQKMFMVWISANKTITYS